MMTNPAVWNGALGVLTGATWNIANLWILSRLLSTWMSPSRSVRQVVGWLILKLAVLYPLVIVFLQAFPHLAMSFGVGFTMVLGGAITWFAVLAQRALTIKSHGR